MDFLADVSMDFSSFNMPLSITKLASKSPSLFVVMRFILQCLGGLDLIMMDSRWMNNRM